MTRSSKIRTSKICSRCKIEKPSANFYKRSERLLQSWCIDCCKIKDSSPESVARRRRHWGSEKAKEAKRKYYADNPEKMKLKSLRGKIRRLQRVFNISGEDWARLFNSQNCKCAICEKPLTGGSDTQTDHCHRTGKVRGMLCRGCNRGIGYLKDSSRNCVSASEYIERNSIDQ